MTPFAVSEEKHVQRSTLLDALMSRLVDLVLRRDFELSELQGGLLLLLWGIWHVWLLPAWDAALACGITAVHTTLVGSVMCIVGSVQVCALFRGGISLRRRCAIAALAVWTYCAFAFVDCTGVSPLVFGFSLFAIGSAWGVFRLQRIDHAD